PSSSTRFPYTTLFRSPHRRPVPGESRGPHPLLLPEPGLPGRRPGLPREAQAPMARTLSAILTVLLLSGGAAPAQERSLTLPQGLDRKSTRLNSSHGSI